MFHKDCWTFRACYQVLGGIPKYTERTSTPACGHQPKQRQSEATGSLISSLPAPHFTGHHLPLLGLLKPPELICFSKLRLCASHQADFPCASTLQYFSRSVFGSWAFLAHCSSPCSGQACASSGGPHPLTARHATAAWRHRYSQQREP